MTDVPEKIWACKEFGSDDWDAGTFCTVSDGGTEYTRTDVTDARIKELEAVLIECRDEIAIIKALIAQEQTP
jgi:hypothetical protein